IVIRAFADGETEFAVYRNGSPRNAGRFLLFQDAPLLRGDRIDSAQVTRTHPQFLVPSVPSQSLRCCRWRSKTVFLDNLRFDHLKLLVWNQNSFDFRAMQQRYAITGSQISSL